MDEIRILQLGEDDWNQSYRLPKGAVLDAVPFLGEAPGRPFDIVFLDRAPLEEEIEPLYRAAKPYTVFVTERAKISGRAEWLCRCKKAAPLPSADIQRFLMEEVRYFYPSPYGEKMKPKDLAIAQDFAGSVRWNGNCDVTLEGDFGKELCQAAFWRKNDPLFRGQAIDYWLEYDKTSGLEISLSVRLFRRGSLADVVDQWEFDEGKLENVIRIDPRESGYAFLSLRAKGRGRLRVIALHKRISRGSHGYFLPGGERYAASNREEIFCYFHPGDLKPPLNVYFSGYKTGQGFEGYHMMERMGSPFLLLAEQRLEGGSFYMGSAEYERLFVSIIKKYMEELGFTGEQVILSGISMGAFGALYYGCDIMPHALIVGKPLASIGDVAANEKHWRPGGFPTSLDVLKFLSGGLDEPAQKRLNGRFWEKFDRTDWGRTKLVVSYMLEDDYDGDAYENLLAHLDSGGVQVYGKGIHGRHNDNTSAIVNWFSSQYENILREDFSRRVGR